MSAAIDAVGRMAWCRIVPVALILPLAVAVVATPAQAAAHVSSPGSFMGGLPDDATAYVVSGNSDTVTPVDIATSTPGTPIPVGDRPGAIAITPAGQMAYVLNQGSGTVTPIDTGTNTAGAPIPVGGYLEGIVITPDSKTAYVLNGNSVTPIDTATNTAAAPIPVGPDADAIAITPDGQTVYVTNWTPGTVTPIATATNTAGTPIPVGTNPNAIAITPDGRTAYAENWTAGTVTPIDTATNTPGQPVPVGSGPDYMAITPDGKTLYVAAINSGTVTPIDTATNTAGAFLPVGFDPYDIAITPDSATAYVAVGGSEIEPIATATDAVGPPIEASGFMAVTPDGKTLYTLNGGGVTPVATATNTPGPLIPITGGADAIAFTPVPGLHPPAFTSRPAGTAAFGVPYSFTVTATGDPAPSIGRTGRMPAGLRFTDNHDGTATISGTPSHGAGGTYQLTLTASNKAGTATQAFTLTVTRAPTIRKPHPIRGRIGIPLHRTIHAKGYPTPALTETGALPAGLSFSDNTSGTATISGTPAAGSCGRYPITITATNSSGTATQQTELLVSEHRAPCTGTGPGHIYWTNQFPGSTGEANLDGTDPHTIITVPDDEVSGVAVNKTHVYWATDGSIGAANLDGSDPHTIITGLNSSFALAVGCTHLYWTEFGGLDHGPGIWEANLNGSDPRPVVNSGLGSPDAVAVNSTHLYWADNARDEIVVANLDGSDPHILSAGQWGSLGVAASNTHVYWENNYNSIAEADPDGTDPHTIITDQNGPFAIAVDGTHLYWTDYYPRSIDEANLDGTDPHKIITGQGASGMAVSAP